MSKSFLERVKESNVKPVMKTTSNDNKQGFKTIAIVNNKGGVGKTTIAFNFACILAHMGKKVLVLDNDPQANASRLLQKDNDTDCYNMSRLYLNHEKAENIVEESGFSNVWIIPTSIRQEETEEVIVKRKDNLSCLNRWIKDNSKILLNKYSIDYIIIDCSPSMGVLNKNAYLASDALIIILGPDLDAINGLINFGRVYEDIYKKETRRDETNVKAVVLNQMNMDSLVSQVFLEQIQQRNYPYKQLVLDKIISYSDAVALTKAMGKPINILSQKEEYFTDAFGEMKSIIEILHDKEVL